MPGFTFDASLNVGQILEIVSFVGAGVLAVLSVRADVQQLGKRMERAEAELSKQTNILIDLAKQNTRIEDISHRLNRLESRR